MDLLAMATGNTHRSAAALPAIRKVVAFPAHKAGHPFCGCLAIARHLPVFSYSFAIPALSV
jgi:hypothetical protein